MKTLSPPRSSSRLPKRDTALCVALAGVLALLCAPTLHAITVSEPPDMPNSSTGVTAAFTYTLTAGTNTFSGTVTTPNDGQDNFQVVVPAGLQILSVTKNITDASVQFNGGATFNTLYLDGAGTGTFPIGNVPLPAGTYAALVNANFSVGNAWTITITTGAVPDYSIITGGGTMTVTNNTGGNDTLAVSESGSGSIAFTATGRTFRANTGALNSGSSGSQPLSGSSTVQINGGAGNETINVNAFTNTGMSSLSITGGGGANTVNFNGNITFANNDFLSVDATQSSAGTVNFTGAQIVAKGIGTITVLGSRNVSLTSGSVLQTANGAIDVEANQQGTPTAGNFVGVNLNGSGTAIKATGTGTVTVMGIGGNDAGGSQSGVKVAGGAQIIGGSASPAVTVTGVGGAAPSGTSANHGVQVSGAGSLITSSTGGVSVTGTAGAAGAGATSFGLSLATSAAITTPGTGSVVITLAVDSLSIDTTSNITANGGGPSNVVHILPGPTAARIDLGGVAATGTLILSDAVLDRVFATEIDFESTGGNLVISAPITRTNSTNVKLIADGGFKIQANASGTDLAVGAGAVTLGAALACPITGATPDATPGFPQLNVAGGLNLNGVGLDLTGTTLAGTLGQVFTIIPRNGTDNAVGTFANLPEGALLAWPGSPLFYARISYVGGAAGNDITLTLVSGLAVTTTADTGAGSLRNAIANAATHAGVDAVTFDASLNGQTITLTGPANGYAVTVADSSGVTLDASNLTNGLTIQGSGASGNFGLFRVNSGSSLTLRGITLANAGGNSASGGAVNNLGTATLSQCTLAGNTGYGGGAISNSGALTLAQCTISGNASVEGGAIFNQAGTVTVSQCTLANNSATLVGGAIYENGTSCTIANSIVASNSGSLGGADIYNNNNTVTISGANVVQTFGGSGTPTGSGTIISAAPVLAPLGSYGGPAQTMPPLPGSPAIDGGVNLNIPLDPSTNVTFTTDQRGFTRISNGKVDIGAVETSALSVTSLADDGSAGTLRAQINAATDLTTTLAFASGLAGGTIQLTAASGQIALGKNIAFDAGSLPGGLTINGGGSTGSYRLFSIAAGKTVFLRNLTLANGGGSGLAGQGGALINSGTLAATQCVFTGNSIPRTSGNGGAVYNANGAVLTLNACAFSGNFLVNGTTGGAGGALSNDGTLTATASSFSGNTALSGGAILNNGTLTLSQCTLAGNTGSLSFGQGGAVYSGAGNLNVTQCTISANAAGTGGGIYVAGGALTLTNSIVGGNSAGDIFNNASVVRAGANIVPSYSGTASTGSGSAFLTAPPLLAPLGNYGGNTLTLALLSGSPARNASVGSAFTTDQRGFAITDGSPDLGAYEAGNVTNYNAWIYENLPASTASNAAQHTATFDYDGDGVNNYNEWLALTNPADPASYLRVTLASVSGATVTVSFPSVLGRNYTIENSGDLKTWMVTEGGIAGTGGTITRTYGFGGSLPPRLFFHVLVGP